MPITFDAGAGATNATSAAINLRVTHTQDLGYPDGFSNIVAEQVPGTSNQARVSFILAGRQGGTIYCRFKSNYTSEGKNVSGGFPITLEAPLDDGLVTLTSAANLVPGTSYTAMLYWSDGTTPDPADNAVYTSNAVAISSTITAPTVITPGTITIPYGTASGAVVATLGADAIQCTFAEGTPDNSLLAVASDGTVTLTTAATTPGTTTLKVTATNSGGSKSQDVTVVVQEQIQTGGTADFTETSIANLVSRVSTLNGTTFTGTKIIELAAGSYTGSINLSGYTFMAGGKGQIVIRGAGTPTSTGHPTKITSTINLSGSSGIKITGFEIITNGNYSINLVNTTDCSIERNWIKGAASPNISSNSGREYIIHNNGGPTTRAVIRGNFFEGFRHAAIYINNNTTDCIVEWNAFDILEHDYIQWVYGQHTRNIVRWNLFSGRYNAAAGTSYHEDCGQHRSNSTNGHNSQNLVWEYNLCLTREWFGASGGSHQHLFLGSGCEPSRNITFRQNFHFGSGAAFYPAASGSGTGSSAIYNTAITPLGAGYETTIGGNADYNVTLSLSTSNPKGAGPNGLVIVAPSSTTATRSNGSTYNVVDDLSPCLDYMDGTPSRTAQIEAFKPKVGTRLHWSNNNPVGCYDLMKRIFVDGEHWENFGWPVAVAMRRLINQNNALANSTYTGSFNADGSNA